MFHYLFEISGILRILRKKFTHVFALETAVGRSECQARIRFRGTLFNSDDQARGLSELTVIDRLIDLTERHRLFFEIFIDLPAERTDDLLRNRIEFKVCATLGTI